MYPYCSRFFFREQQLSKLIFDSLLDESSNWTGTICRIVGFLLDEVHYFCVVFELYPDFFESPNQSIHLDTDNLGEGFWIEWGEDDNLVDSIDKLRSEKFIKIPDNSVLDRFIVLDDFLFLVCTEVEADLRRFIREFFRSKIGSHDHNRVFEIHLASFPICQNPVF